MLTGLGIKEAIDNGIWKLTSIREPKFGPNSMDVRLDRFFKSRRISRDIDTHAEVYTDDYYQFEADRILLRPGESVLGSTEEKIDCSGEHYGRYWVPHYDGRSTMGRIFICSHVTAGKGDYGFGGYWTLEIVNLSEVAVTLHAGDRIGQVWFEELVGPVSKYESVYEQAERGPALPVLGRERFA